jgi:hypothetical protein
LSTSEIRRIPAWHGEGHPVMRENRYHVKFSLNSTKIILNYKETSPEFIAGERKKKKGKKTQFIKYRG